MLHTNPKKGQSIEIPALMNRLRGADSATPEQVFYVARGGKNPTLRFVQHGEIYEIRVPTDDPVYRTARIADSNDLHPVIIADLQAEERDCHKIKKGAIYEVTKPIKLSAKRELAAGNRVLCVMAGAKPQFLVNHLHGSHPSINATMIVQLNPSALKETESAMESSLSKLEISTKRHGDGSTFRMKIIGPNIAMGLEYGNDETGGLAELKGDEVDIRYMSWLAKDVLEIGGLLREEELEGLSAPLTHKFSSHAANLLAEYLRSNGGISSFSESVLLTINKFRGLYTGGH